MEKINKILVSFLYTITSLGYIGSFKIIFDDNISLTTQCDPNRIYKKDDITCVCTTDGRWPHENCSLIFRTDEPANLCEPDDYVIVGCNVCRCNEAGRIEKDLCTKHDCDKEDERKIVSRRSNRKNNCEPNHWYTLSNCAVCYCANKNNLMCSNGNKNPKTFQILSKYNLTDCGTNFVDEVTKLVPVDNSLRLGNKKEKHLNSESEESQKQSVETTTSQTVTRKELLSLVINHDDNESVQSSSVERNDIKLEDGVQKNSNEKSFELGKILKEAKDKLIGRIAANTAIPFDSEEADKTNYDSNESDGDNREETDKDVSDVRIEKEDINVHEPVNESVVHITIDDKLRQGIEDNDEDVQSMENPNDSDKNNVFNLNLPMMLGKVLSLGLRRSLLSLDNSKCVPGTTVDVKCNTCYCMKNGKLLCTRNICE